MLQAKTIYTDIMTIRDLAAYLKTAEKTLYRIVSEGNIPGFKVGGAWRFRKTEIDKWIADQENSKKKSEGAILERSRN